MLVFQLLANVWQWCSVSLLFTQTVFRRRGRGLFVGGGASIETWLSNMATAVKGPHTLCNQIFMKYISTNHFMNTLTVSTE